MNLQDSWNQLGIDTGLNYADIEKRLNGHYQRLIFKAGQRVLERGDFPSNVFLIVKGEAIGQRHYEDGSQYHYFQVNKENGNLGLLEVLSRQEKYVATITAITDIEVLKVDSARVYELIMSDLELLRKCSFLLADDLYRRSNNDGLYYFYSGIDRVRLFLTSYFEERSLFLKKQEIAVDASYQVIANQVGLSVRTIGRSIKKLKELGEVEVSGKKITLTNEQYEKMQRNFE